MHFYNLDKKDSQINNEKYRFKIRESTNNKNLDKIKQIRDKIHNMGLELHEISDMHHIPKPKSLQMPTQSTWDAKEHAQESKIRSTVTNATKKRYFKDPINHLYKNNFKVKR